MRDYILANSAAALWVARQTSLREGTALAASAIDSGAALGCWSDGGSLHPLLRVQPDLSRTKSVAQRAHGRRTTHSGIAFGETLDPEFLENRVAAGLHPQA